MAHLRIVSAVKWIGNEMMVVACLSLIFFSFCQIQGLLSMESDDPWSQENPMDISDYEDVSIYR